MRRLFVLGVLLLSIGIGMVARAQILAPILFGGARTTSYSGPGDIVSGALAWYGLRGYSGAFAAPGTGKSIALVNQGGAGIACDVVIASSGNLGGMASSCGGHAGQTPQQFAGTDATCTATIASTTMTVSSCSSGTLHVNDQITGAGITSPSYIASIGTCASPPGTCTLNAPQTVAVGETVTATTVLIVGEWYDQTGGGHDLPFQAGHISALFFYNCINNGTTACALSITGTAYGPATISSLVRPYSFSSVGERTSSFTSFSTFVSTFTDTVGGNIGTGNTSNTIYTYCNTNSAGSPTANDNVLHAIQGVCSTTNSVVNVDGSELTGATGTGGGSTVITIMTNADVSYSSVLQGLFEEGGAWAIAFSSGNRTSMCKNQQSYYGAGNFGATC